MRRNRDPAVGVWKGVPDAEQKEEEAMGDDGGTAESHKNLSMHHHHHLCQLLAGLPMIYDE